ncbi:MAG: DUF4982 domain-containing protein [Cyclobacteriaceae bacterium]
MNKIHQLFISLLVVLSAASCTPEVSDREVIDFNFDWKFVLDDPKDPNSESIMWENVRLPHDWSIREGYRQENTSASTGFVPGGIGWYKKEFELNSEDLKREIWIEFDGVYCNSEVWINGELLGFRPNGYSSFKYDLTPYLVDDTPNVLLVKVDHSAYADTRWYTGSGIYRNVRLVKVHPTHIAHWGVRVATPEVSESEATIQVSVAMEGVQENTSVELQLINNKDQVVASELMEANQLGFMKNLKLPDPQLWDIDSPNLYQARTLVRNGKDIVDSKSTTFGIRSIRFDANQGFFLNDQSVKIKGVNLHHDAGALGAAVTKPTWIRRVKKLKSIGVNAIRMSHNPHSVELMDVCDELGMLVMDEFFDEWHKPKGKNLKLIGDNKAQGEIAKGYSEHFLTWAERDLKDLIRRDFNHPSVIMWSIGNEIEWTFPEYSRAHSILNAGKDEDEAPIYDPEKVIPVYKSVFDGPDSLAIVADLLVKWVKEEDTTRPTVCGSVRPPISLASGYGKSVDVLGFNYRQGSYDKAHETYPDLKIIGSENWGAYSEWKAVKDRDFVAGMFAWTGYAYLGEAGPWPRKGLEIAFFDYAGFKTPRGHFFECLWKDDPKVYAVSAKASESEFSYSKQVGWKFDIQWTKPPVMWERLRMWEWYPNINEHWNYEEGEEVIVQVYTNCDEVELLVNNESQGRKKLSDFSEDNIVKWAINYQEGNAIIKGYNNGKHLAGYALFTNTDPFAVILTSDKDTLLADHYDLAHISLEVLDTKGHKIKDAEVPVQFTIEGPGEIVAVDNGSENNVQSHYANELVTSKGNAYVIIRNTGEMGTIKVFGWYNNEPYGMQEIAVVNE